MPDVTPVPSELSRSVSGVARALVAAARAWTLYPASHPAVRAGVERLNGSIDEACRSGPLAVGVTPETLLIHGTPVAAGERPVVELAALLHQRDILQVTLQANTPPATLEAFLSLIAEDLSTVRQRGGPERVWQEHGLPHIHIEQIDFARVLEDRDGGAAVTRKDDVWQSIVRGVLDRRRSLDEATQRRLLDIAGDAFAIGDLATDVMAPHCTPDGSPLLTSQAAAVLAAYRHLVAAVDVMAPDRRDDVLRNLASATATLDPHVVMQVLGSAEVADGSAEMNLGRAVSQAMDDSQVAQLLATTLAIDGQASQRLAAVFGTIAPDEPRRRRVLTMARSMLTGTSLGSATSFQSLWTSTEELLLAYNERPFVAGDYRAALDGLAERAEGMASDVPADLAQLVTTLEEDNIRRLSATLLIDLLAIEDDAARAGELARDMTSLAEDLLLGGDYAAAATTLGALARHAADRNAVTSESARVALDALVNTSAFHESVQVLGEMDDDTSAVFAALCASAGPACVDALATLLAAEEPTKGRLRAARIIRGFGTRAVKRLTALAGNALWSAQRNAAEILGDIGSADAVPLLQPLLRAADPRVTAAAVRALASIDDPSAARCVHTALRATTGAPRAAVVAALVAERDPRVVPLLSRILDESDPLGTDHDVVLQTLGAVGAVGGDGAIPAVDRIMRKTKWFARPRLRAVKTASVRALRQIGTPAADAAISRAASTGDRLLKRVASETGNA